MRLLNHVDPLRYRVHVESIYRLLLLRTCDGIEKKKSLCRKDEASVPLRLHDPLEYGVMSTTTSTGGNTLTLDKNLIQYY